ncbi:mucin-2-like [Polyodon spathula]|uniref:mucin-2-like n=1 Tax=Polyodon spathula TaxID=7913 RepID=UPI001B7F4257|nr:mucin-2-like [Polyodon spathula]
MGLRNGIELWALVWLISAANASTMSGSQPEVQQMSETKVNIIPGMMQPIISAVNPAHNGRVCSTWGNYHFKMFDGDMFNVPSSCNYVLTSQCKSSYEDFNIQMRRAVVNDLPTISTITMKLDGIVLQFTKNAISVNGKQVTLPFSQSGVLIEKINSYIKVTAKLGLVAMWNEDDSLVLEIDEKYMNQTCGLCGDFNGVQVYDELIQNGMKISPLDFANFWKMDSPTETCIELTPPSEDKCADLRPLCEQILSSPALATCKDLVPVDAFVDACVKDMCQCNNTVEHFCLCNTISEYSRQCVHAGGKPQNWRTDQFCSKKCSKNMVFQECGIPCTDTCSNPDRGHLCEDHCTDGCFCPAGTVLDDITQSGCIPLQKCSCSYNGKTYSPGESYSSNCRRCTCNGGRWSCNDLDCPGSCSVKGGSHITSYDGQDFTFHGDCSYVLSKNCQNNAFTILGEIVKCGLTDTETCLKSVTLAIAGGQNVFSINPSGSVFVNGMFAQLPLYTANVTVFRPSSFYIIVQTSFDLVLEIQLTPIMQVYITAGSSYKGQTCGLCGNFNDVQADDFKANSGVVEGTASAFANTWKTQASCPDMKDTYDNPCSLSVENEKYALHWCSMLLDPQGPFSACHSVISPATYKTNCMYDSCNCEKSEDCMCAAISSYVHACAAKGVHLDGWRSSICTKYSTSCPRTLTYSYSMTSCDRTCRSLSEPDYTCMVKFVPVDGCGCAEGTYMDEGGICVPPASCPCYNKGSAVTAGEVINRDGAMCTCKQGKLNCIGESAQPSCADPMVFFDCSNATKGARGSECQKSCQTLDMECYSTECASGCVCPQGLLSDGKGGCVSENECPCIHNGASYNPGETIKVDCNTCTCKDRKWQCTDKQCQGTCAIYGDGHYITFDGKRFSFNGDCEYTLTQDYCSGNSANGTFRVITENIPCGTTGTTCSKAIKLFLGNNELILTEGHYQVVQRDSGEEVPYKISTMGIYMVIEAKNGLILMWDKKTSMFIKLSPSFQGHVCGLCGDYDGNGQNDFTTRSQAVVVNAQEFGNSWKVSPSCPDAKITRDPCVSNPYRQSWAQKQCSLIKSKVFTACHSQVDPTPYYDACVRDSCACDSGGDCECFCTAVASYAEACNEAGVCVAWRSPEICPLFCDYYNPAGECEWHYKPCGAPCMKTCRNPSGTCSSQIPGLEGCYPKCPPNQPYFDEESMKCVQQEDCGCYDDEGNHYKNGEEVTSTENCQSCLCKSVEVYCSYDIYKCYCSYQGNKYPNGATIYNTTDGLGSCIIATCGENGTIHRNIYNCKTTKTPHNTGQSTTTIGTTQHTPTVFNFTTSLPTTPTGKTTTAPPLSPTATSESTTSGTTSCLEEICQWSEWYDVSFPTDSNDGDYETYDKIKAKGHSVCANPLKVHCRAQQYPNTPLGDLGQVVQCNSSFGLKCNNKDNPTTCLNYEISAYCCNLVNCGATTSAPPVTSKKSTTPPVTTSTTPEKTPPTSPPVTTSTTPETTPPTISTEVPHTTSPTTTCRRPCKWSQWFDTNFPTPGAAGGDSETYNKIVAGGGRICEKPSRIECRAEKYPEKIIEDIGQVVTCDIATGLTCKNEDQTGIFPMCYNYQIRFLCCDAYHCETTTEPPTSTSVPTTAVSSTFSTPTPPITTTTGKSTTTKPTTPPKTSPSTPEPKPHTTTETSSTTAVTTTSTEKTTSPTTESTIPTTETATTESTLPSTTSTPGPVTTTSTSESTTESTTSATPVTTTTPSTTSSTATTESSTYKSTTEKPTPTKTTAPPKTSTSTPEPKPRTTTETSSTTAVTTTSTEKTTSPTTETSSTTSLKTSTIPSCIVLTTTTPSTTSSTATTESSTYKSTTEKPTPTKTTAPPKTSTSTPEPKPRTTTETSSTTAVMTTSTEKTTSPTTETSSTTSLKTSTIPSCIVCKWSEWKNVDYPEPGPGKGDYETIKNLTASDPNICEKPDDIECRASKFKDYSLEDVGQKVECSPSVGFVCKNEDQVPPVCFDYEVRVKCCINSCTSTETSTPNTETTSPIIITSTTSTSVTEKIISQSTTSTPVTQPTTHLSTTTTLVTVTETATTESTTPTPGSTTTSEATTTSTSESTTESTTSATPVTTTTASTTSSTATTESSTYKSTTTEKPTTTKPTTPPKTSTSSPEPKPHTTTETSSTTAVTTTSTEKTTSPTTESTIPTTETATTESTLPSTTSTPGPVTTTSTSESTTESTTSTTPVTTTTASTTSSTATTESSTYKSTTEKPTPTKTTAPPKTSTSSPEPKPHTTTETLSTTAVMTTSTEKTTSPTTESTIPTTETATTESTLPSTTSTPGPVTTTSTSESTTESTTSATPVTTTTASTTSSTATTESSTYKSTTTEKPTTTKPTTPPKTSTSSPEPKPHTTTETSSTTAVTTTSTEKTTSPTTESTIPTTETATTESTLPSTTSTPGPVTTTSTSESTTESTTSTTPVTTTTASTTSSTATTESSTYKSTTTEKPTTTKPTTPPKTSTSSPEPKPHTTTETSSTTAVMTTSTEKTTSPTTESTIPTTETATTESTLPSTTSTPGPVTTTSTSESTTESTTSATPVTTTTASTTSSTATTESSTYKSTTTEKPTTTKPTTPPKTSTSSPEPKPHTTTETSSTTAVTTTSTEKTTSPTTESTIPTTETATTESTLPSTTSTPGPVTTTSTSESTTESTTSATPVTTTTASTTSSTATTESSTYKSTTTEKPTTTKPTTPPKTSISSPEPKPHTTTETSSTTAVMTTSTEKTTSPTTESTIPTTETATTESTLPSTTSTPGPVTTTSTSESTTESTTSTTPVTTTTASTTSSTATTESSTYKSTTEKPTPTKPTTPPKTSTSSPEPKPHTTTETSSTTAVTTTSTEKTTSPTTESTIPTTETATTESTLPSTTSTPGPVTTTSTSESTTESTTSATPVTTTTPSTTSSTATTESSTYKSTTTEKPTTTKPTTPPKTSTSTPEPKPHTTTETSSTTAVTTTSTEKTTSPITESTIPTTETATTESTLPSTTSTPGPVTTTSTSESTTESTTSATPVTTTTASTTSSTATTESSTYKSTTEKPTPTKTTLPHKTSTTPSPTTLETTPGTTPLSPTTTESTSTETSRPTPTSTEPLTTSLSWTECTCNISGRRYPPGANIYNNTDNAGWCYTAFCSDKCEIEKHVMECHTTTVPPSAPTTKKPPTKPPTSKKTTSATVPETTPQGCNQLNPPRKYHETWKIDKCTKATCEGGSTVNVEPVPCKAVEPIECVNGLPPLKVYDESGCCYQYECQCTCYGWGDPHYVTFDGTAYDFQGDCTYVLVKQITPKYNNFSVIIENYLCGAADGVSCPRSLTVYYKKHEVFLTQQLVNGKKKNMIKFDNKEIIPAFSRDGIQISSTGIDMSVEIPEISAQVSFRGLMFVIQLPYSLFHGNTEGQCGICDNNKKNDCSGPNQVVEPCPDSAHDWRINKTGCSKPTVPPTVRPSTTAKPPSTPSLPASSTPPPPASSMPPPPASSTPLSTTVPSQPPTTACKAPICEIIYSKVFEACNEIIPANPFYEACYYDVCHMPGTRIGCSSLEVYASMCETAGVCVDWRKFTNGKCKYSCPPTKEYQACGPDVQPTCNAKYNEKHIDQNPPSSSGFTEGCFCPNGTILFNSFSDVCVSSCGCTGADGMPKKPNETWQSNCQDCVCDKDSMSVQCKPHVCPEESPVTCSKEGQEQVMEIDSQCCNKTTCKCNVDLCPKTQQSCDPGFRPVINTPEDGCCPEYTCVPKEVCVFNNTEYQPGSTVPKDTCETCQCGFQIDPATKLQIIDCVPILCDTECQIGFRYEAIPGMCCGECVQKDCVVMLPDETAHVIQPGQVWSSPDNNCTRYECVKNEDKLGLTEINIFCPPFNPKDCIPGTETHGPDGCCLQCKPKPVNNCNIQKQTTKIVSKGCQSNAAVELTSCGGSCGTYSMYSSESHSMMHSCTCCRETKTSEKTITLSCPDSTTLDFAYIYVEECGCQDTECVDNNTTSAKPSGQEGTETTDLRARRRRK